jgi:hypothetical protein
VDSIFQNPDDLLSVALGIGDSEGKNLPKKAAGRGNVRTPPEGR